MQVFQTFERPFFVSFFVNMLTNQSLTKKGSILNIFGQKIGQFPMKLRSKWRSKIFKNSSFFRSFWNFKLWFAADSGRYLAGLWPMASQLRSVATRIFYLDQTKKLTILDKKNYPPPKKKNPWFLGGGLKFPCPDKLNLF